MSPAAGAGAGGAAEAPPDVTAVVMAYDEAATVGAVTDEILGVLRALGRPFEVIVVDDGSRDGTGDLADRLAAERAGVRAVHHGDNRGLGGVYRTGFAEARGRFVTFFPADGQFPASILADFRPRMEDADMVLGTLPERRSSPVARALSRCEKLLYRALFGGFPEFQGILMFRRDLLDRFPLRSTGRGWAALMELILRAQRAGCRVVLAPTTMRPRASGRSKVNNLRTIWANLRQVLALRRLL